MTAAVLSFLRSHVSPQSPPSQLTGRVIRRAVEDALGLREGDLEGRKRLIISTSNAFMAEAQPQRLSSHAASQPSPAPPPFSSPSLLPPHGQAPSHPSKRFKREEADGAADDGFAYTAPVSASAPSTAVAFRALRSPASAAAPPAPPPSSSAASASTPDEPHIPDKVLDLQHNKLVTVSTFNGRALVHFREYYQEKETGLRRPGKKGLALTRQQWNDVKVGMHRIDAALDAVERGEGPVGSVSAGNDGEGQWDGEEEERGGGGQWRGRGGRGGGGGRSFQRGGGGKGGGRGRGGGWSNRGGSSYGVGGGGGW